jgi:hypothetical protein
LLQCSLSCDFPSTNVSDSTESMRGSKFSCSRGMYLCRPMV